MCYNCCKLKQLHGSDNMNLKINMIQMNPSFVCSDDGIKKIEFILYRLVCQKKKPNVIVFSITSFEDQYIKTRLKVIAKKMSINIILGSLSGIIYFIDRQGNLTLCRGHFNDSYNKDLNVFDIDGICCAAVTGDDIKFPQITGNKILQDAQILFVIASWPKRREDHWELLNIVRAIENKCFVVAANGTGKGRYEELAGRSLVVNPWGQIMVKGGDGAKIFSSTPNLEWVKEARKEI